MIRSRRAIGCRSAVIVECTVLRRNPVSCCRLLYNRIHLQHLMPKNSNSTCWKLAGRKGIEHQTGYWCLEMRCRLRNRILSSFLIRWIKVWQWSCWFVSCSDRV